MLINLLTRKFRKYSCLFFIIFCGIIANAQTHVVDTVHDYHVEDSLFVEWQQKLFKSVPFDSISSVMELVNDSAGKLLQLRHVSDIYFGDPKKKAHYDSLYRLQEPKIKRRISEMKADTSQKKSLFFKWDDEYFNLDTYDF